MTYRLDSEVFNGYGAFLNKTSRKEIKLNGFLQFDRKYHSFESNLSKYKIAELSERPKDIAWLVSHCKTPSRRENYVKDMKEFSNLQIDVMGNCGFINPELPSREARKRGSVNTYQILAQQYKFYLRAESFISVMADLFQDITRVSSFCSYLNRNIWMEIL